MQNINPSGLVCPQSNYQPYGFGVQNLAFKINVRDVNIPMTAVVNVLNYTYEGPVSPGGANTFFFDPAAPIGICANYASTWYFTENMYLRIGGVTTPVVRTNYWEQTSDSPHHGTMTNNNDFAITF